MPAGIIEEEIHRREPSSSNSVCHAHCDNGAWACPPRATAGFARQRLPLPWPLNPDPRPLNPGGTTLTAGKGVGFFSSAPLPACGKGVGGSVFLFPDP